MSISDLLLVNDHVRFHELEEALHIQHRVHSGDLVLGTALQPFLEEVFSLLLKVVILEVVYDRDVVDVASTLGNVLVTIALLALLELLSQFAYIQKWLASIMRVCCKYLF